MHLRSGRGDYLLVNIDDDLYQQGFKNLEKSLFGRMLLKQGTKPMPTPTLKDAIDKI